MGDLLGAVQIDSEEEDGQGGQEGVVYEPVDGQSETDGRGEEEAPPTVELADSLSGQIPSDSALRRLQPIIPAAETASVSEPSRPDGWFSWADDVESDLFL